MKLMIVDDNKLLRNGFRHMADWESKGIDIVGEAMNGVDALEKIIITQPDVVLTDISMPIMDGIELTKKIKSLYPHIVVVILSGYDDYEYVRESMKNGASDYLLKASVDVNEIYELLQKIEITKKSFFQSQTYSYTLPLEKTLKFDKETIKTYLELQDFKALKKYIISELLNINSIPVQYLQDVLRDLFFFIQFHLDQLNILSEYIRQKKFINSSSVALITNTETAIEWVTIILDELTKHCTSSTSHHKEKFNTIIKIINENYSMKGLTLSYIADQLFMNKNYLCDIFKAEANTTINQYILDIRINKAKSLIREGSGTLQEIANNVGFSDYNYFSRVFRKKMGMPPSEYHKLYM